MSERMPRLLRQSPPLTLRNWLAATFLIWAVRLSQDGLIGWFVMRAAWKEGWRPTRRPEL